MIMLGGLTMIAWTAVIIRATMTIMLVLLTLTMMAIAAGRAPEDSATASGPAGPAFQVRAAAEKVRGGSGFRS